MPIIKAKRLMGKAVVEPYAGAAFKDFLKGLKRLTGVGKASVEEASTLLKSVNSTVRSVDEAVKSLPVSRARQGYLLMGEETVGSVNKILREGDLSGLVRISKRDIPYTSADTKAFKSTVADVPEKKFRDVQDLAASSKKSHPQLDVSAEQAANLSNSAKADVKKIENNLSKKFAAGTKIALTIGAIYVGVDWLTKATEQRKGCFMLTTLNGKTTSCKVQAYSCIGSGGTLCSTTPAYYNTTLVLMKIATLANDDARKIKVAEAAGVSVADLQNKLATIIDQKYEAVSAVITAMQDKPALTVCELKHPDIEKGVIPPCRLCSPSDNPISTTFIDSSQYPDNVTFQCVINPSLLDTAADAIVNTGENILNGVGGAISGALKPILIVVAVILVLVLLISILVKFVPKRKQKTEPSSAATTTPTTSTQSIRVN